MRFPRILSNIPAFLLGCGLLTLAGAAFGHRFGATLTEEQKACLETCREANGDCHFDARESAKLCMEEAGCDALRTTYREACLVEAPDATTCSAARDALRNCIMPCREAARTAEKACKDAGAKCATETCGIAIPTRPTPSGTPSATPGGPGHGPGGHGPGGHGPRPPRGPQF